jgi:hypothetical protein
MALKFRIIYSDNELLAVIEFIFRSTWLDTSTPQLLVKEFILIINSQYLINKIT